MAPRERLTRTEAIVLRQQDYGEADRILTLLTPGGKRTALAKGIRRATSRKSGQLGLFYRAQLMLAQGRTFQIVTQAESLEEFEGVRNDLLRFTYACYAAELVDRFAQEDEESGSLYDLTVKGLRWFATEPDLRLWMRYFEVRLLALSGYQPELYHCVGCQAELQAVPNVFSAAQGGLLCRQCLALDPTGRSASVNAQKVLRFLLTHDVAEVRGLRLHESTQAEVEALLLHYMQYVLERELKSITFLRHLRNELHTLEQRGT
jgi:DNA repair protein RecO (recombination protein O)